jgi:hypothetical protein
MPKVSSENSHLPARYQQPLQILDVGLIFKGLLCKCKNLDAKIFNDLSGKNYSTQNQGTGNLRIQPKSTDQQKAFTSIFNFFNLKSKI